MWKDRLRPLVRPLPQWSPIAVASPQRMVTATLHRDGKSTDVTADHTVASLEPLTIATGLDAGPRPLLEFCDRATGASLGILRLTRADFFAPAGASVVFYHVATGEHRCLAWPQRAWNGWLQNHAIRKSRASQHTLMAPDAVQHLMIAYLCPRPVVLVSVAAPGHSNVFPMDLIGPLEQSGTFSLALRSTNVSIPVVREAGRVALSGVPAMMKDAAYKLAEHHKHPLPNWDALPFPMRPSQTFDIPVVAAALRIQELAIEHSQTIGSHVFFLCRVVSEESPAEGDQLHHTAGFHQAYRRRHGKPFVEA